MIFRSVNVPLTSQGTIALDAGPSSITTGLPEHFSFRVLQASQLGGCFRFSIDTSTPTSWSDCAVGAVVKGTRGVVERRCENDEDADGPGPASARGIVGEKSGVDG